MGRGKLNDATCRLRRDDAKGPCEAGAKWEQAPTNRTEGTVLSSGTQAGIVHGGALIGFPNQQEAAAMGHVDDFVATVRDRPGFQHIVVTGRDAPQELIEAADLVSEVVKVKHPMDAGIRAQQGIEW